MRGGALRALPAIGLLATLPLLIRWLRRRLKTSVPAPLNDTIIKAINSKDARWQRACAAPPSAALRDVYFKFVQSAMADRAACPSDKSARAALFHSFAIAFALGAREPASKQWSDWSGDDAATLIAQCARAGLLLGTENDLATLLEIALDAFDLRVALHDAAKAGNVTAQQCRGLPSVDEPPVSSSWPPRGETALHVAARAGQTAAVSLLLARGACVHRTSADGWCALHFAALVEAPEVAALLLARGARLDARTTMATAWCAAKDATPLHVAAFNGRLAVTTLLVAKAHAAASSSGLPVNARDEEGRTPQLHARAIAHLLNQGCACHTMLRPGQQFGAVISHLEKVASMETVEEAKQYATRRWELLVVDEIVRAVECDETETDRLSLLLDCYGDDVNARDHDGSTALHAAAQGGHAAAVGLLLARGADPRATTNYDDCPLHFAAREGHLAAATLLMEAAADVASAKTRFGQRPADLAARGRARDWEAVSTLCIGAVRLEL